MQINLYIVDVKANIHTRLLPHSYECTFQQIESNRRVVSPFPPSLLSIYSLDGAICALFYRHLRRRQRPSKERENETIATSSTNSAAGLSTAAVLSAKRTGLPFLPKAFGKLTPHAGQTQTITTKQLRETGRKKSGHPAETTAVIKSADEIQTRKRSLDLTNPRDRGRES